MLLLLLLFVTSDQLQLAIR